MQTIGILALQGDFAAHAKALQAAGYATRLIKNVDDLDAQGQPIDGLVLPGGESTTMYKLLRERGLWEALDQRVRAGLKTFTTCAGTILAAAKTTNPEQPSFGWLPIHVERNAYGDQRHSFTATGSFNDQPLEMFFIRAPRISSIDENSVRVLMRDQGLAVLVEYRNILAATFHPELAGDPAVYRYCFSSRA